MSSRYVYAVAAILILSAAYGCWSQAPLIWDGAYQFDMTLATQHPYVYLTRFHTYFLWYPTVWLSRCTSNVNILQAVYGLPFLLAPAVGLLLSWWMVRKQAPYLIIWVIFGVAAATLPGQIFVINDSLFQLHLFWPLFVAMFVPLNRGKIAVFIILAVFQFVHPLGAPLMFGSAVAAALVAATDKQHRRRMFMWAGVMAALCVMAAAKIIITNHIPELTDKYAQGEATWANAVARWRVSVEGAPLHGLAWMWTAAGLAFLQPLLRRRYRIVALLAGAMAILCVVRGASHWLYWAHGPVCLWGGAIDYRRWVGPLAAPFFLLATLEVILHARRAPNPVSQADSIDVVPPDQQGDAAQPRRTPLAMNEPDLSIPRASVRGPLAVIIATVFALTLGMQYTTWHQRTTLLMQAVRAYPRAIVPNTDPALWFVDHSPLAHWGSGNYVAAMLGKQPEKMFIDEVTEDILRRKYFDPATPVAIREKIGWYYYAAQPDMPPGPGGWFDFRPALERARQEQSLSSRRVPGRVLNGIP